MSDILQNKALILAVAAAILFVLEKLFRQYGHCSKRISNSTAASAARALKNLSMLLINAGLSPLLVIPLTALAAQWSPDWRPDYWSGAPGLAADLADLDLWIYWWHRANHLVPLFWRFHQVHHLDEFLDVTTAVRFHFGEVVFSAFVRAAFIFVLAIPLSSVIVFETARPYGGAVPSLQSAHAARLRTCPVSRHRHAFPALGPPSRDPPRYGLELLHHPLGLGPHLREQERDRADARYAHWFGKIKR